MNIALEQTAEETMTAEEFFNSPYAESCELVKGRIVPKGSGLKTAMPTGAKHGVVTDELQTRLSSFVRKNKLGRVFAAETGFVLGEGTVRGIDISFVNNEKIAEFGIPDSFFPTAPDLAVEVISPGNTSDEIQSKVNEYISAGTKLVWIVYPKQKMIHIYRQGNVINILRESDEIDGGDVLPDFKCKLSEIFE